jgi:ribosomal-protein-alanine N-acetyltransferase
VARQLLDHLLRVAYSQGARGATLEVRKSNAVARNLYASLGFAAVGVRKEYYTDNKEDAVIMWLRDLSAYFERKEQADG